MEAVNQILAILNLIGHHVQEVLGGDKRQMLSLGLSFPILERLLKVKCHAFVELDGEVTQRFEVRGKPYGVGGRVSSLEDLLYLYELYVASSSMRDLLTKFKQEVMGIFPTERECYGLIYKWRNNALHGASIRQLTHAVVINLICLLMLDSLQSQYEALRTQIKSQVESRHEMGRNNSYWPWTLFPPDQLSHL
jgi:hypothetical protein